MTAQSHTQIPPKLLHITSLPTIFSSVFQSQSRSHIATDGRSVSPSVRLGVKIFILIWKLLSCPYGTLSLTRGRVCRFLCFTILRKRNGTTKNTALGNTTVRKFTELLLRFISSLFPLGYWRNLKRPVKGPLHQFYGFESMNIIMYSLHTYKTLKRFTCYRHRITLLWKKWRRWRHKRLPNPVQTCYTG
jgi:hypothetical protein